MLRKIRTKNAFLYSKTCILRHAVEERLCRNRQDAGLHSATIDMFVTVNTVKLITQVSNKTGFTVRKSWCYRNKILGRCGFENCILTILHCWTLYMYFIEKLHIIF